MTAPHPSFAARPLSLFSFLPGRLRTRVLSVGFILLGVGGAQAGSLFDLYLGGAYLYDRSTYGFKTVGGTHDYAANGWEAVLGLHPASQWPILSDFRIELQYDQFAKTHPGYNLISRAYSLGLYYDLFAFLPVSPYVGYVHRQASADLTAVPNGVRFDHNRYGQNFAALGITVRQPGFPFSGFLEWQIGLNQAHSSGTALDSVRTDFGPRVILGGRYEFF